MAAQLKGETSWKDKAQRLHVEMLTDVVELRGLSQHGPIPFLSGFLMAADEIHILRGKVVVVHRDQQIASLFERFQIAKDSAAVGVVRNQPIQGESLAPLILLGNVEVAGFESLPRNFCGQRAGGARGLAVSDDPDLYVVEVAVPMDIDVEVLHDRRMIDRGHNDMTALVCAHLENHVSRRTQAYGGPAERSGNS